MTAVAVSLLLATAGGVAVDAAPASAASALLPVAMTGDGSHIMCIQSTGRVVNFWLNNGQWQGPGGTGGTARADSGVATTDDGTSVVFIDPSGNVVDDSYSSGWHGPLAIGGTARAGSPIAMSADGTHVVFVDPSGRVVNDWLSGGVWNGPAPIGGTARADSPVTINSTATLVAFVDTTGHVAVDSSSGGAWQGPTPAGGTARAGSALAASNGGQIVAFIDPSGSVVNDWWATDRWQGPAALGGIARADSPLALNGAPDHAYFVDTSGRVVNDWVSGGTWQGPATVGGTAHAGSPIATVDGSPSQVVFVDPTQNLAIDWVSGGNWNGPGPLKTITPNFHGVNWADADDNFSTGVLHVSGLTATDTYDSAAAVADQVVGQLFGKTGANTVRIPINEATVSRYWDTYRGAIDAALVRGNVILAYWTPATSVGAPPDMNSFYAMWDAVVATYGGNTRAFFEVINEPHGQSNTTLDNMYAAWLSRYPSVPRQRVILDGNSTATDVTGIGADSRLDGTRIAVHDYTWFDQPDTESEAGWSAQLAEYIAPYANRTLMTEWGAPMNQGTDYLTADPGNKNVDYVRGVTRELRSLGVGSVYWPGFSIGDGFSLFRDTGSGTITLTVNDASGVSILRYGWGY